MSRVEEREYKLSCTDVKGAGREEGTFRNIWQVRSSVIVRVRQVEWELMREREREWQKASGSVCERRHTARKGCMLHRISFSSRRCAAGKRSFPAERNRKQPEDRKMIRASNNWVENKYQLMRETEEKWGGKRGGNWGTGTLVTRINISRRDRGSAAEREEEGGEEVTRQEREKCWWLKVWWGTLPRTWEWLLSFVWSVLAVLSPYPFSDPVPSSFTLLSPRSLTHAITHSLSLPTVRPGRAQRLGPISLFLFRSSAILLHSLHLRWLSFYSWNPDRKNKFPSSALEARRRGRKNQRGK